MRCANFAKACQRPVFRSGLDAGLSSQRGLGADGVRHEAVPLGGLLLPAAGKAANDYFLPRHKLSTQEEEYEQYLHFYGEIARLLPELEITRQNIEVAALEKVYQPQHTFGIFQDALSTLQALRGRYKLGVISDTWPSIRPVLDAFGLTPYFDCFTFSFELGRFKPDRRMYEDALAKMGLPPEECAFIDDGVKNLQGAQAAGIQPVLITAKPGAEECPPGMASIQTISGILELLA